MMLPVMMATMLPLPTTTVPVVMQSVVLMTVNGVPNGSVSLGASLRDRATLPSPLRGLGPSGGYPSRLRALRALRADACPAARCAPRRCRPTPSRQGSTALPLSPPYSPRAGAARRARHRARLARPGRLRRLRASPQLGAAALRAPPPSASPSTGSRTARCTTLRIAVFARAHAPAERMRTSLRTAPGSRVRTSADTAAGAAAAVLRTTPCSNRCTSRRSSAAAASTSRRRRRRFPEHGRCSIGRPVPPGRSRISHPTHRW